MIWSLVRVMHSDWPQRCLKRAGRDIWVPARPESGGWRYRVRAAWEVLCGRADAIVWPEDEIPHDE